MAKKDYNQQFWENRNAWLYELARDARLSANAVRIGLIIGTFVSADNRETVKPGYAWLMKAAGINSKTTIASAIRQLIEFRYLDAMRRQRMNTAYSLPFDGETCWKRGFENPQSPENGL